MLELTAARVANLGKDALFNNKPDRLVMWVSLRRKDADRLTL